MFVLLIYSIIKYYYEETNTKLMVMINDFGDLVKSNACFFYLFVPFMMTDYKRHCVHLYRFAGRLEIDY